MKAKLPKYTPAYLEKNNLWDSKWLQEKYPQYFNKQKYKDNGKRF